jgi:hypothetical protein
MPARAATDRLALASSLADRLEPAPASLLPAIALSAIMANLSALRRAQALGHLGLLPLFGFALLAWMPSSAAVGSSAIGRLAQPSLAAYASVILAFLGGTHWGGVLLAESPSPSPQDGRALTWGAVVSLLGWLALLLMFVGVPAALVFAVLIGDFLLVRLMDAALLRQQVAAAGFLELRSRLTAGALLALAIGLAAAI